MSDLKKYLTKDRQKQRNLSDILYYIVERGGATRREIEHGTGFSWGAVSESVGELLARGYLVEEEHSAGRVGRSSAILKPNGTSVVAVGLDVNRTELTARLVGFDLSKKWRRTLPFTADTQDALMQAVEALCDEAVAACPADARIISIGVAMQGKVDAESGVSYRFPGIPAWEPFDVRAWLSERYALPVSVDHDPKCLLFAKTVRENIRDGLLLRLDRGIGLSVVIDGKILSDFGRMELGHTISVPNGELCACGRRGCLEAYASIRGIERRTGRAFSDLIAQGDPSAFDEACAHLATALSNVAALFAPERIILTGKLAESDLFYNRFVTHFAATPYGETAIPERDTGISAAYGAAVRSIRDVIKSGGI